MTEKMSDRIIIINSAGRYKRLSDLPVCDVTDGFSSPHETLFERKNSFHRIHPTLVDTHAIQASVVHSNHASNTATVKQKHLSPPAHPRPRHFQSKI
jgi:hypothetical protein